MFTDRDDGLCEAEIYSSWPLNGGTGLHAKHLGRPESTAGSRAERLDDYVTAAHLDQVDFMKLDVDGFECHVLGGSMSILRNRRPVILMELCPYALTERGRSFEELLAILQRAEYRLYYLDGQSALPFDPAQLHLMVREGASLNVIGRPN